MVSTSNKPLVGFQQSFGTKRHAPVTPLTSRKAHRTLDIDASPKQRAPLEAEGSVRSSRSATSTTSRVDFDKKSVQCVPPDPLQESHGEYVRKLEKALKAERREHIAKQEELDNANKNVVQMQVKIDALKASKTRHHNALTTVQAELEQARMELEKTRKTGVSHQVDLKRDLKEAVAELDVLKPLAREASKLREQLADSKKVLRESNETSNALLLKMEGIRKSASQTKADLLRETKEQIEAREEAEAKLSRMECRVADLQRQVEEQQEDANLISFFGKLNQLEASKNGGAGAAGSEATAETRTRVPAPLSVEAFELSWCLADMKVALRRDADPCPEHLTTVMPNILLSGEAAVMNAEMLDRECVTHIISCFKTVEQHEGRHCLALHIEDEPYYPALQHMDQIVNFLRTLERRNRCVIYCRLGINRSAAVAIALLMRSRLRKEPRVSGEELLHKAFRDVNRRHGRVLTNYGFQRQLLLYANNGCRWCNDWGPETWLLLSNVHVERAYSFRSTLLQALEKDAGGDDVDATGMKMHLLRGTACRFGYEWMRRQQLCFTPSMYKP